MANLDKFRVQSEYQRLWRHKEKMFALLYRFTFSQCGHCVSSGCACKDKICQHVEEQAAKRGFKFKPTGHALRFIGEKGCIIPPHLRETCTIYLCGPARQGADFDHLRYDRIRAICDKIEWRLMELEDQYGAQVFNH